MAKEKPLPSAGGQRQRRTKAEDAPVGNYGLGYKYQIIFRDKAHGPDAPKVGVAKSAQAGDILTFYTGGMFVTRRVLVVNPHGVTTEMLRKEDGTIVGESYNVPFGDFAEILRQGEKIEVLPEQETSTDQETPQELPAEEFPNPGEFPDLETPANKETSEVPVPVPATPDVVHLEKALKEQRRKGKGLKSEFNSLQGWSDIILKKEDPAPEPVAPVPEPVVAPARGGRDPRLPPPGTVLTKAHKGQDIRVVVTETGFEWNGTSYKSLSKVAQEATGQKSVNGFAFFRLTESWAGGSTPEPEPELAAEDFLLG